MSSDARLLLVDDDGEAVLSLSRALRAAGFGGALEAAGSAEKAHALALQKDFHVAVLDLTLDSREGPESGFRLLGQLARDCPLCRIIVLTGNASLQHGVRALSSGAAHFLEKPADPRHLSALIEDSVGQSKLRREFEALKKGDRQDGSQLIVGTSAAAERIREEVRFAASHAQAVLITGESGTGKGLCARAIHEASARGRQRLVRYQPSFSNADLVTSDLFGHVKGSFTGAEGARKGLIEEADGGTLFLDEIDALPLETQVSLLGVLQEKRYRPMGASEEKEARFRLLCASNQDLEQCVKNGVVRRDFFHRVAHSTIHLPPLRERSSDIPELAGYVLAQVRTRDQVPVFEFSKDALAALTQHSWPGNIREFEAAVEGAVYRAQFERRSSIEAADVRILSCGSAAPALTFSDQIEEYKRKLIQEALDRNAGNQAKAAQSLGLDRSSLRRILERTTGR
jgi:DNA-binding NtrC family response regulator